MSAIVLVRHPVPSSYVPRGCRTEHGVFRRHRTPVRLREVSASEVTVLDREVDLCVDCLHDGSRSHPCAWYGGRVWAAIGETYDTGRIVPFDRRGFLGWLEAESPGRDDHAGGLAMLFGTALLGEEPGGRDPRGVDLDPVDVRREGYCDRDRASRDLARFMDDRVLLVGGVPHLRLPGPLWSLRSPHNWSEPTHRTLVPGRGYLTAVHGRLVECCEALGLQVPPDAEDGHGLVDAGARPELDPSASSEDLLWFANTSPFRFLQAVGGAVHRWKAPDERLMGPVRALRRWEAIGLVGGISVDEVADVAEDIAAAMEALPAFFPNLAATPYVAHLAAYASRYVLPLLRPDPGMGGDDLDALAGLVAVPVPRQAPSTDGLPLFGAGPQAGTLRA